MIEALQPKDFWRDAADLYEQIVEEGGDPEIHSAFGLNERSLDTVRLIVWRRQRSEQASKDNGL